jgi:hypothetical protein
MLRERIALIILFLLFALPTLRGHRWANSSTQTQLISTFEGRRKTGCAPPFMIARLYATGGKRTRLSSGATAGTAITTACSRS